MRTAREIYSTIFRSSVHRDRTLGPNARRVGVVNFVWMYIRPSMTSERSLRGNGIIGRHFAPMYRTFLYRYSLVSKIDIID